MKNISRRDSEIANIKAVTESGAGSVIDLANLLSSRTTPLPRSLRVVLENLVVQAQGGAKVDQHIEAVVNWHAGSGEITVPLAVSRVMLPDSSASRR